MLARVIGHHRTLVGRVLRSFNLHEYQSMEHMASFEIPTPQALVASSASEALANAQKIGAEVVVKAQVLAGGRGKGHFIPSNFQGGVHICPQNQVESITKQMIGQSLVTKQTGADGKPCNHVLIAEKVTLKTELYLALLLDRESGGTVCVSSPYGGMDIEQVAKDHPQHIYKNPLPLHGEISSELSGQIAHSLGISDKSSFHSILKNLHQCFTKSDLLQLEINPLGITNDERILVCDAKLNFDDNAKFRQMKIYERVDHSQEDPIEHDAHKYDLNYISLEGNIGCLVNGAGLAMATMDLIQLEGSSPANFLDVGGSASEEQIINALRILNMNERVESILLNIFGGIMRCDIISRGLISAVKKLGLQKPIVARLCGTNWEIAKELIDSENLQVIYEQDAEEAVRKAVALANVVRISNEIGVNISISTKDKA